MNARFIASLTTLALVVAGRAAVVDDIGPNTLNGTVNTYDRSDSAGQAIDFASDNYTSYVVSFNAGVWKSVRGEFDYTPWVQLANSPPHAYCIAVDPNNPAHLAVGERDGDALTMQQNNSGVWESYDSGATWTRTLDPLTLAGCGSQAIPSLAFAGNGTLFVVGPCGIGRKPSGATTFDFSRTPPGLGLVTVVVASQSKVWARTSTRLMVSTDDGLNWTVLTIPSTLDGYTITFPNGYQGDPFSLGALDSGAYMTFKPNPDTVANHNTLLIYNAGSGTWVTQVFNSGDGTGLGGRRFVKSYVLNRPDLPFVMGQRLRLFIGVGQEVYEATGLNANGTISSLVETVGTRGGSATDPVHSDIWNFHLAPDASRAWVASDGGVYSKTFPSGAWGTQNQNLFTHYIYTLNTLETDHSLRQRLVYPTPDNDAWYFDPTVGWRTEGTLGDGNWTAADTGNPNVALMVRNPQLAVLTGFTNPLPSGNVIDYGIVLNNESSRDGVLFLQFIQTLKGESPTYPLGDTVMLVDLPLRYRNSMGQLVNVPGPLGQPNPSGAPVLIRNRQFAASPHANSSQFQTWQIEANDLPANARGFWVSGGHANPVYYAYTINEPTGSRLYKRNASGSGWSLLSVTGLLDGGWHGPAFVNPYDPNRVYVLTTNGVNVSTDGGGSFQSDSVLTALLTASGKFPTSATFTGGNGNFLARSFGSHGVPMGTLSDMAFSRDQPNRVVAASPYTGAFYSTSSGSWADLTGYLPRPLASVSAVGISGPAIYVGTQGRGLLRIFLDDEAYCFINGPVLSVPSQYGTVRAAYNAAQDCNLIRITTGTYHEAPITFNLNKRVRLESQGGPVTISR